ncbi:MAG: hypothetical protein KAV42_04865 [Candidatus Krumholzibacteria bacterium]|nr:hypothetical protein [Candidatus Krumholzibacteria bacterium]
MRHFTFISSFLSFFLILVVLSVCPLYGSNESIEPSSWIYSAFRSFELAGLVELPSYVPWSRAEAAFRLDRLLQTLEGREDILSPRQAFLLKRLRGELQGTALRPQAREDRPLYIMREGERFTAIDLSAGLFFRKKENRARGELDGLAEPSILIDPGGGLTLYTSYRLRMEPEWGLNSAKNKPSTREKSFRGLTAEYERAYLSWTTARIRVVAGRDYVHWGNGREESLILSSSAGSLDQVSFSMEMGRFRLSGIHVSLDSESERHLAGHRLEIAFPRSIRLGISETVVYSGRSFDYSYMLPAGSFYANQYNEKSDDNILWGLDWKIPLGKGTIIYGELLIDDFQYEGRGEAPDRLGFNMTIEKMIDTGDREIEFLVAYTYIDIFTYAHRDSLETAYVAGRGIIGQDLLLGSTLGPDSDRWSFQMAVPVTSRVMVSLGADITRRGEGNDLREWDIEEDPDPDFPSGEVVTEKMFHLAGYLDLGRGSRVVAGGGLVRSSPERAGGDESFGYLGLVFDF